ncbi:MAG: hypothetical protein IJT42_03550 [Treponema sp.]|nr:hypothetical protein [Treponema sp.]
MFRLMKDVSESLAGCVGIIQLYGFSRAEIVGKDALKNFSVLTSLNKPIGKGCVICLSSFPIPLDADNIQLPVSVL